MKPLLSALLLFAACAAGPAVVPPKEEPKPAEPAKPLPCKTVCGLRADVNEASCLALNQMEARALYYFQKEVEAFRPGTLACGVLDGWVVKIHKRVSKDDLRCDAESFVKGLGKRIACVYGYTEPVKRFIELNDDAWAFNAFMHEIGHILDAAFGTEKGPDHCGWDAHGLSAAILEGSFTVNETPEKCPVEPKAP